MNIPGAEPFYDAMRESPDCDTTRLVFADWLSERGEGKREDFIRLQCKLAKKPHAKYTRDRKRERKLWEENKEQWYPTLHEKCVLQIGEDLDVAVISRGFINEYHACFDPVALKEPIRYSETRNDTRILQNNALRSFGAQGEEETWKTLPQALEQSPANLQEVTLHYTGMARNSPEETRYALASARSLQTVRSLTIGDPVPGAWYPVLQSIADNANVLPALEKLRFRCNRFERDSESLFRFREELERLMTNPTQRSTAVEVYCYENWGRGRGVDAENYHGYLHAVHRQNGNMKFGMYTEFHKEVWS